MKTGRAGAIALCPMLLAVMGTSASATPIQYTAIDIGSFNPSQHTFGFGINSRGQITGCSDSLTFVYTPGAGMAGPGAGLGSCGLAINNLGQVTGSFNTPTGDTEAFLYTPGKGIIDIPTLNDPFPRGAAINDSGVVAGSGELIGIGAPEDYGFTYSIASGLTQLPSPSGYLIVVAGINASGQITGTVEALGSFPPQDQIFVYTPGSGYTFLGSGSGAAINSSGQITGTADIGLDIRAVLYTPGAGMIQIPPPPGFDQTHGSALNSSGQVVGELQSGNSITGTFLFSGGVTYNLNDLVTSGLLDNDPLIQATGINDNGWIVANDSSQQHTYLLVPEAAAVPEPASMGLVGLGIAAMVFCSAGGTRRGSFPPER